MHRSALVVTDYVTTVRSSYVLQSSYFLLGTETAVIIMPCLPLHRINGRLMFVALVLDTYAIHQLVSK